MSNKQSSVEWFAEKTFNLVGLKNRNWINHGEFLEGMLKLRDEAKAMHEQEIIDSANKLLYHSTGPGDTAAEKYYNETYGGNND
jgi:hypothetical protein